MSEFESQLRRSAKWRTYIPVCAALMLCLGWTEKAKADFVGYYSLSNFLLTNTTANGSATTPDSGQTLVLTGGNTGSGLFGQTDFTIVAPVSGLVQFSYSYFSSDLSSIGAPWGCGPGNALGCDDAGYLLNGTFHQLADDVNQVSAATPVTISFSVTAGQTFGFRVETLDNLDEPGILTIKSFSAPAGAGSVPEPRGTVVVFVLIAAAVITKTRMNRIKNTREFSA